MFNLIRSLLAHGILSLYFGVDTLAAKLPTAKWMAVWPYYDWLFKLAQWVSPLPLPPIFESHND